MEAWVNSDLIYNRHYELRRETLKIRSEDIISCTLLKRKAEKEENQVCGIVLGYVDSNAIKNKISNRK